LTDTGSLTDPVETAIKKYEKHPSILAIKEKMSHKSCFSFQEISANEMESQLLQLNPSKSSQKSDVPTNLIRENSDIFSSVLCNIFNSSIEKCIFPDSLKCADVTPVFKKGSRNEKTNFRPVSILPTLSKSFEKILYTQIYNYIDQFLSTSQCGFRKGYSTQHSLIVLIEKWRKSLDKGEECGALLTDLSKAFDCLPHDLLIAKLNAYGFDHKSLSLIASYLSNRKQRTKINSTFS